MSTTKFDNLVIASRRVAENLLSPGPSQVQNGQPGDAKTRPNAEARQPQPSLAPQVAPQQQQAQPRAGAVTQKSAAASASAPKKKPAAKRKRDDSQPKRPRGRPRKYPLPPDFHSTLNASRPQAAPVQSRAAPAPGFAASAAAPPARLANGAPRPSAPPQNGPSQPGMSLYEAWSRNQGAGFLGSPSKQAAMYALRNQQQQMQREQLLQQHGQEQSAGQPQEYFDLPANGFMALMQEYPPALAGALAGVLQDGHFAALGFPAPSPQPAAQGAASAQPVQNPPVIRNPQGPLPAFSTAEAATQDTPMSQAEPPVPDAPPPQAAPPTQEAPPTQGAPLPQGVVPGLATRSPSRRKPQKSPIKPQQGVLAGTASPTRMQQALSQGIAASSPARAAASPAGRSRAQRKNAATPQRVVPGGVIIPAAQPASAGAPSAEGNTQRTDAAAPATGEGVQGQAGAAGTTAQQDSAEQERASGLSKPGPSARSNPSQPSLDVVPSPQGETVPVASVDYPGLRRSKRPAKMRDMTELQKGEPQISEKAIHELPAFHVSRSHSRPVRSTSVRKRAVLGPDAQVHASTAMSPAKAAQSQVTGPTEISEAATVSEHAQPEPPRDSSAAKRSGGGVEAPASKRSSATTGKQQSRSEVAASPLTRGSAVATRSSQSEPAASMQMPSPVGVAAFRARMQQQPLLSSSAPALRPTGGPVSAPQQQAAGAQQTPQQIAQPGGTKAPQPAAAAVQGDQAGSMSAAQQLAEALAAPIAPAQASVSARSVPAQRAAQLEPQPQAQPASASQTHTPAVSSANIAADSQAPVAAAAAAVLPVSQAAVAPVQPGDQETVIAASASLDQGAATPQPHSSPNGTPRSQQTLAAWGALKEQLNNILLSCLAEEAKRAQAAQEAIEVCRAAEEGLEHLNKQYSLQQNFHTTYAHVVDEVSEALQATSAANRRVQEVQERLNAVQEELKREVAAAEVARGRAMTVLRRQATLKEEMEVARGEVARILHQPQTDLEQLRETVNAQKEHAGNMRAAKDAAVHSLTQCRQDKDRLLTLMNSDPPPTTEALAAAGIGCSAANPP